MNKVAFLVVMLLACVAFGGLKPTSTAITSTSPTAAIGLPLVPGGLYAVQCDVPAYVKVCGGNSQTDGGYSTGGWAADGGSLTPDGGPTWIASTCLATSSDPLFQAGAIMPVQLGGSDNHLSVLAKTGTAVCKQFTTFPSSTMPPVPGNEMTVAGRDGGPVQSERAPGSFDCAGDGVGTITSTGTTDHGNLTVTAGGYYVGYCNGYTFVGGATTLLSDGGNLASCASQDGGTIPRDDCFPYSTNERFQVDLRNTTRNSIGATSGAAATVNCPVKKCAN